MENDYILAINPGATSTKIAVYRTNKFVFLKTIRHAPEELDCFSRIGDQLEMRMEVILDEVESNHIPFSQVGLIIARGGLIQPIESGIYEVNQAMISDLETGVMGEHASNLGGLIANRLKSRFPNAVAYIADPVVVDEMQDVARISGHPDFPRTSIFHALNQKSIARSYAHSRGMEYEDLNLVIAHLGSGISVGAHKKGKVIDVNNALDGEGPFGPERSGTLPAGSLIKYCFSEGRTMQEAQEVLVGKGGLFAYFGHKDAHVIEKQAREFLKDTNIMVSSFTNDKGSAAIVLFVENSEFGEEDIKDYLFKALPVYMVPEKIIQIKDFPKSPGRKISKSQLMKYL